MRLLVCLTLCLVLASIASGYVPEGEEAAIYAKIRRGLQVAPDRWIVTVEDLTTNSSRCESLATQIGAVCGTEENLEPSDFTEICVVAFTCDKSKILDKSLQGIVDPELIEPNLVMHIERHRGRKHRRRRRRRRRKVKEDEDTPTKFPTPFNPSRPSQPLVEPSDAASWGLDRINQPTLPLDGMYSASYDGSGVNVYVVDTGVLGSHNEFRGRYTQGFDAVNENRNGYDMHGHGTHCAGTIAGEEYGVAPGANVIGVKVLGASSYGDTADIIRGVNWAVKNQQQNFGGKPAVISMSLGGGRINSMDQVVKQAAKAGMVVVVAAGNSNDDACHYSPARAGGNALRDLGVITVMSSDKFDRRSSFSNFGRCTDIIAPGTNIESAWIGNNGAKKTISGTSMATPHVAGVMAQLLQKHNFDKESAVSELFGVATPNVIRDTKGGSKNLFLQVADSYVGSPTPRATLSPTFSAPSICVDGLSKKKGCFGKDLMISNFGPDLPLGPSTTHPVVFVTDIYDDELGCKKYPSNSHQKVRDAVVVVSRGDCTFYQKVENAKKKGAKAIIIYQNSNAVPFNPGSNQGELDTLSGMISRRKALWLKGLVEGANGGLTITMGSS